MTFTEAAKKLTNGDMSKEAIQTWIDAKERCDSGEIMEAVVRWLLKNIGDSAKFQEGLDLDKIEAEAAMATPEPWIAQITTEGYLRVTTDLNATNGICGFGDMEETDMQDHHNSIFIARARTHIPTLVAEVRRLRGLIEDKAQTKINYQYSEYQVRMHRANCFCQVSGCPHCNSIAKSQRDNPELWRGG